MTRRRAFTLIEVLVVVAIIALLIAIATPSIQEARRLSKRTYCLNNLHEIGIGLQAYAQINRERFPVLCSYWTLEQAKPVAERRPPLSRGLTREVGYKSKVFECPADVVTEPPTDDESMVEVGDVRMGGRYCEVEETSYEWNVIFNGLHRDTKKAKIKSENVKLDGREVELKKIYMLVDFEAFHNFKTRPRCRNYLYPDLRVESEKADENKEKKLGKDPTPLP